MRLSKRTKEIIKGLATRHRYPDEAEARMTERIRRCYLSYFSLVSGIGEQDLQDMLTGRKQAPANMLLSRLLVRSTVDGIAESIELINVPALPMLLDKHLAAMTVTADSSCPISGMEKAFAAYAGFASERRSFEDKLDRLLESTGTDKELARKAPSLVPFLDIATNRNPCTERLPVPKSDAEGIGRLLREARNAHRENT